VTKRWPALLATPIAAALFATACGGDAAPKPPNVVLLLIDTTRADHLPCYGYHRDTMPRTCRFARDAVTFTHARSVAPWTLPAHASLFTGVPPGEHGLHWGHPSVGSTNPMQVRNPEALLAERLREHGYTTVGISSNPWVGRSSNLDLGFDHFVEVWDQTSWLATWKADGLTDAQPAAQGVSITEYLFAEREVARPYFLFVSMIEPHMPYSPAEDLLGTFGGDTTLRDLMLERRGALELDLLAGAAAEDPAKLAALYDEELATVDRSVGQLLDWLKERGDYDDALVIVTSDHGEHLGEAERYSHQLSMARELLWIPLLVKFPDTRPTGSGSRGGRGARDERRVSLLDVYATILAASGAAADSREKHRWARDLGHGDAWSPRLTLAESYFSERYSRALSRRSGAFDADAHRVVRRSWFSQDERFDFVDSKAAGSAANSATSPGFRPGPEGDRALQRERAYAGELSRLSPPGIGERRVPQGDAMVQELQALGYLE
jgi:choline-sulfatase